MTDRADGRTARTSARRSADAMQVLHLAGVAAIEPLAQEPQLGNDADGRDAAEVEPDRLSPDA